MVNKLIPFIKNRILGHQKYTKFIIITTGRSGSEWLISILNSHANCYARGELFKYRTGREGKKMYTRQFEKKWKKKIKAIGFKIFYQHPLASNDNYVWDKITNDTSIKVIQLIRKNQLRRYLSVELGNINQQWTLTNSKDRKKTSLVVNPQHLIEFLIREEQLEKSERFLKLKKRHQVKTVYYEDIVRNYESEIADIISFLELPQQKLNSNLKKQNPNKLSNIIENYEEIKDALNNTDYKKYLNEEIDM